ncbi:ankyrin [Gymnopus androsaceus JB14]|uniref:Ankyrin n=1 Tax=Gymnopus androsaceus JB14 TaxID=1447944 RepID=A0A6A4GWI6_9AGAR|nr:ankyrin [Gymnopus androsaceus JB14]
MSFGVGVGDVVLVAQLAWTLYKGCRDSNDDFRRLSTEVASLHIILKETEDIMGEFTDLDISRRKRLQIHVDGCNDILKDLQKLLNSYESLRTQSQRTWDRMRFGLEDLADVRSRLISQVTLLTAYNTSLASASLIRLDKRLTKFYSEVRAGYREGSIISVPDAIETIESPDVWNELRRELEDVGLTPALMEEHRPYITNWMKEYLLQGTDADGPPNTIPNSDGLTITASSSAASSSSITVVSSNEQEFEAKVRQKQPSEELLLPSPPLKKKKAMDPTRLVRKLLQKQTAIVQAASDGDLDKVINLIKLGCNVNAMDRWGWSALSMAAYGNHLKIARVLLDHGADINNVDVDGDTPYQLATNRGHSDMLILFDLVTAERDLRAREEDAEQPRR